MILSPMHSWLGQWRADVARAPHCFPAHALVVVKVLDGELRAGGVVLDERVETALRALHTWCDEGSGALAPLVAVLAPLDRVTVPPDCHRAAAVQCLGQALVSVIVGRAADASIDRAAAFLDRAHLAALRAAEASSACLAVQKAEVRDAARRGDTDLALGEIRRLRREVRSRAQSRWVDAFQALRARPSHAYRDAPSGVAW